MRHEKKKSYVKIKSGVMCEYVIILTYLSWFICLSFEIYSERILICIIYNGLIIINDLANLKIFVS